MKYFLLLLMVLSLSGCATAGRFAHGFSQGMSRPAKTSTIPQTQYCYGSDDGYAIHINCY